MHGIGPMKRAAIVYTSDTGHTRQYALLLGGRTGLVVYSLKEARTALPAGSPVIYLGCIHASRVKGYARAARRYAVCAVCGVGLCDTGTLTAQVRKTTAIPEDVPLFTLQGGIDRSQLRGVHKLIIAMLTKGLTDQKQRSEQDERILELLRRDENLVSAENLADVLAWYTAAQA